ncbi:LpqB family beta-propeller domain-containing protein [Streptomyces sp. NPDC050418]|uniref:LpqB family beta-propeller domain-containing protein n=1 Tax=Streptomyces sp. NPDC050418 TaxID=3365612 RepID=UPI003798CEF0
MGAERAGRRRRSVRNAAVFGCGGLLLAGCASMPSSGEPEPVDASPNKPAVRVFATPPKPNAAPGEIVDGFLETLTGDDPDFSIARKYLTADAAKTWDPNVSTTILAAGPKTTSSKPEQEREQDQGAQSDSYELEGSRVATLDADSAYRPELEAQPYTESIQLVKEGKKGEKQWRIDELPPGVVLGEPDFRRLYKPVDKYYYADFKGDGRHPQDQPLVADPVYVRGEPDPELTDVVKALLAGPTRWLDPVVGSRFPSGTQLREGTRVLAPDEQKRLQIPLNNKVDNLKQDRCKQMAAQIYFTLKYLATPSGIKEVELLRSDGESPLCVLDSGQAQAVAADPLDRPEFQYFLDEKHQLVQLAKNQSSASAVPGELGEGKQELRSAAVSRDEDWAAGVSGDGRSLIVGELRDGAAAEKTKVLSRADKEKDRLTAPSWDGRGDLWVADQNPGHPKLLWLEKGSAAPVEVGFDQPLGEDGLGRVKAVRVAADGVRIALLVEKDGRTELSVGRIERTTGKDGDPELTVAELRPAAPKMEEVTAMSWGGGSRLLVVGKAVDGVQQMRFVQSDGSLPSDERTLPGLTGVTAVAAAENPELPLLAGSQEDGIVRLGEGEGWKPVDKEGSAPVYPG